MESSNRVCLYSYTFRCLLCMEGDASFSLASKSHAVQEHGWAGDFVSKTLVQAHNLAFDSMVLVNNSSRHWISAFLALTKNVNKEKKELYNLAVMHLHVFFLLCSSDCLEYRGILPHMTVQTASKMLQSQGPSQCCHNLFRYRNPASAAFYTEPTWYSELKISEIP